MGTVTLPCQRGLDDNALCAVACQTPNGLLYLLLVAALCHTSFAASWSCKPQIRLLQALSTCLQKPCTTMTTGNPPGMTREVLFTI